MRNLKQDFICKKPSYTYASFAVIPIVISACSLAFANGANPNILATENPIFVFCLGFLTLSLVSALAPLILSWKLRSYHYGIVGYHLGSISLLSLVPAMGIALYSSLPFLLRAAIPIAYIFGIAVWCRRTVVFYRKIFIDDSLRKILYVCESDACYFLLEGDAFLCNKKNGLDLYPSAKVFLTCIALTTAILLFSGFISTQTEIPTIQAAIAVMGFPIALMGLGISTKCWLIFYYYPYKIQKLTGLHVYVDMDSAFFKPAKIKNKS